MYIAAQLPIMFCKKYILKELGDGYQLFFQHLGFKPPEIRVARANHNKDAESTMLELWNK